MPATRLSEPDYTKYVYPTPAALSTVFSGLTADPIVITLPFGPQGPPAPSISILGGVIQAAALPEPVVDVYRQSQGLDSSFGVVMVRKIIYHDALYVLQATNRIATIAANPHHVPTLICPPLSAWPYYRNAPETATLHDPAWLLHASTSVGGLGVGQLKLSLTPAVGETSQVARAGATHHMPSQRVHSQCGAVQPTVPSQRTYRHSAGWCNPPHANHNALINWCALQLHQD